MLQTSTLFCPGGRTTSLSYGVNYVRQTEIHTAEPLVPGPKASEIDMAIEKLKRNILPDIDEIPAPLIKAGGTIIRSEIHKGINSI